MMSGWGLQSWCAAACEVVCVLGRLWCHVVRFVDPCGAEHKMPPKAEDCTIHAVPPCLYLLLFLVRMPYYYTLSGAE